MKEIKQIFRYNQVSKKPLWAIEKWIQKFVNFPSALFYQYMFIEYLPNASYYEKC